MPFTPASLCSITCTHSPSSIPCTTLSYCAPHGARSVHLLLYRKAIPLLRPALSTTRHVLSPSCFNICEPSAFTLGTKSKVFASFPEVGFCSCCRDVLLCSGIVFVSVLFDWMSFTKYWIPFLATRFGFRRVSIKPALSI